MANGYDGYSAVRRQRPDAARLYCVTPEFRHVLKQIRATQFKPDDPREAIRLYEGGASICTLAEACGVSDATMERFLRDSGVYRRPHTIARTRSNKGAPQRPVHIAGQELSDAWWDSNNQAFCDAMAREYPGMKF